MWKCLGAWAGIAVILALCGASCENRQPQQGAPVAKAAPAPAAAPLPAPSAPAPTPSAAPAAGPKSDPTPADAPKAGDAAAAKVDDPFPKGAGSAEGVACDLARAFIAADEEGFRAACVPATGSFENAAYTEFLDQNAAGMKSARAKGLENAGGPKKIARVYTFRHLSKNGPGSYVYAARMGKDIGFVDVIAELHQGGTFQARTLVLQLDSGEWRVIPEPSFFPLLSTGLNDETDSTELWKAP
jgi:hypothetical protein